MQTPVVVLGALAFFAGAGLGPVRSAADEDKPKTAAPAPDLSGSWAFNKELSDDARLKLHDSMERSGGGYGRPPGMGGGGMGAPGMGGSGMGGGGRMPPQDSDVDDGQREAMRALLDPAEELTVYQGQPEIVLDEKFSRRRTLHADGRKYKADNGASEVKSEWKEGRLVIETRGFRGRKTTESWELSATGKRLTSLTKVESGFGAVTIKRVYDKVGASPAP